MADKEKVIKGLGIHADRSDKTDCDDCPYSKDDFSKGNCICQLCSDALALLKEQEAVEPKTITEELKQKMWNALYAEEDAFEEKYVRTKEHDRWFLVYRPWLQEGFNLAIKAIADYEGR